MANKINIDWDNVDKEQKDNEEVFNKANPIVEEGKNSRKPPEINEPNGNVRKNNVIALIFIIVSNVVIAGIITYLFLISMGALLGSGLNGVGDLFGDEVNVFSFGIAGFVGFLVYALVIAVALGFAYIEFCAIFFALRNIFNVLKVNKASDKVYTKNLGVAKTVTRLFIMMLFGVAIAVLSYYIKSVPNFVIWISAICSTLTIVAAVLLLVELGISKKRYKAGKQASEYSAELKEKQREITAYLFKRRNFLGQTGKKRLF